MYYINKFPKWEYLKKKLRMNLVIFAAEGSWKSVHYKADYNQADIIPFHKCKKQGIIHVYFAIQVSPVWLVFEINTSTDDSYRLFLKWHQSTELV